MIRALGGGAAFLVLVGGVGLSGCFDSMEPIQFSEIRGQLALDGAKGHKPPDDDHDSDDHDSDHDSDGSGGSSWQPGVIGQEVAVTRHLVDGDESTASVSALLDHGRRLFSASWTAQEGGGRPLSKGTGAPLTDLNAPLIFPRNFNRISAPDANGCAGCHNQPFGVPGGGGDVVTNVFVLGQRFDFATFDTLDDMPTRGAVDEQGAPVTLETIANSRSTLGMFGSGYIEMLARQITTDLQAIRDNIAPGQVAQLSSKGVSYGELARRGDGTWDTTGVRGLPPASVVSAGGDAPNLIVRPFHQAGAVVSLRQFTNNAFNHHHGIQTAERFGDDADPDGDGFTQELTRADVTAVSLYQATLAVPGRVIPNDDAVEQAVWQGEQLFSAIGCASCHVPALPLSDDGWVYSEPNPFNPPGNLSVAEGPVVRVNLTDTKALPAPRLKANGDTLWVPAYTDLKLHDICSGPGDPNVEALDMQVSAGSDAFFDGNRYFLTRKLWGVANEPPYFHHGRYTTMRQAIEAHAGEASETMQQWGELSNYERDTVVEFLKSLQVLPPGTKDLIVDENFKKRSWPPT